MPTGTVHASPGLSGLSGNGVLTWYDAAGYGACGTQLRAGQDALRAARRRDFDGHRDWMMRNYALTFLAVTARVLVPLLLLVQVPFRRAEAMGELANSMIPVGQTLGWVVNLIVVERIIRRRGAGYDGPVSTPAGRS